MALSARCAVIKEVTEFSLSISQKHVLPSVNLL